MQIVNVFRNNLLIFISFLGFSLIFLQNAWFCDDAYISFRAVENLVSGYGPVWNVGERVQVFTHPLWLFLVAFFRLFTGEVFYTVIILSYTLTLAALYLFRRTVEGMTGFFFAFLLIISSKAFIDYTTSGLENPLSYFLISVFLYFEKKEFPKKTFILTLIFSLLFMNRMDAVLLLLPALFYLLWKTKSWKQFIYGLFPVFFWEMFSLFYFGFPFPNTAYAKLGVGVSALDLMLQGAYYLLESFFFDPVTLTTILIADSILVYFIISARERMKNGMFLLGSLLYMFYVVKIGGDFMSGRFFALPFLFSIFIIAKELSYFLEGKRKTLKVILLIIPICLLAVLSKNSPVLSTASYGTPRAEDPFSAEPFTNSYGIADERAYYYPYTGFFKLVKEGKSNPTHLWAELGKITKDSDYHFISRTAVGFFGYFAGPKVKILDGLALVDAFLARLPMKPQSGWRIGHFRREIPSGYPDSFFKGENLIADERLSAYYDKLSLIIRGDLFSRRRILEIIKLNLGFYNYLLHTDYAIEEKPIPFSGDIKSMAQFNNLTGVYYAKRNNLAEAEKYFETAINLDKDNFQALFHLFMVYHFQNDSEKAKSTFIRLKKEGVSWKNLNILTEEMKVQDKKIGDLLGKVLNEK